MAFGPEAAGALVGGAIKLEPETLGSICGIVIAVLVIGVAYVREKR